MPTTTAPTRYHGRFAPSPTGPLHFGSLVAAVGSFLEARHQQGLWLLRIDDLDTPRVVKGAADQILRCLEAYGLYWDETAVFQSERRAEYRQAMEQLRSLGASYPCGCTRNDLETLEDGSRRYPGHCRQGLGEGRQARSERVATAGVEIRLRDRIQGDYRQHLDQCSGDFLVVRAGGLHGYHLATVVDDAAQGISEVVRGADLLSSTPSQIHLQRLLGLPTPSYCHLPVAVDDNGAKLSKQQGAPPLDPRQPQQPLVDALTLLGQRPAVGLQNEPLTTIWDWALAHWDLNRVPVAPLHHPTNSNTTEAEQ